MEHLMKRNTYIIFPTIVFLSMVLFSGCSVPLKSDIEPTHIYRLSPQLNLPTTFQKKHKMNLYIPNLEIMPGLDSKKIVLFKSSYEQDFIADSQWPDELPIYLHSVITDALSASNAFASVSNRLINTSDNYKLLLKFSSFQAELTQNQPTFAQVVVSMEAFVIHSKTQKLLMHKRYRVKGEQVEVRVSSIVRALNTKLGNLLGLLVKDISALD
jgi:ABC-type uncharacterized transport system auxiliary subunit